MKNYKWKSLEWTVYIAQQFLKINWFYDRRNVNLLVTVHGAKYILQNVLSFKRYPYYLRVHMERLIQNKKYLIVTPMVKNRAQDVRNTKSCKERLWNLCVSPNRLCESNSYRSVYYRVFPDLLKSVMKAPSKRPFCLRQQQYIRRVYACLY